MSYQQKNLATKLLHLWTHSIVNDAVHRCRNFEQFMPTLLDALQFWRQTHIGQLMTS